MKVSFASLALLAAMAATSTSVSAETLTIPWTTGKEMSVFSWNCVGSLKGGVRPLSVDPCHLVLPFDIPSGRVVKQVRALYGHEMGGPVDLNLALQRKDLTPGEIDSFNWDDVASWSAGPAYIFPDQLASGNLMAQGGFAPNYTYPDQFPVETYDAYRVDVSVEYGGAEFFGIVVLYQ